LNKPFKAWRVCFGSIDYLIIRRSRPTGDLFFCVAKKAGQKGEPLHGRAKIPRLFLAHPLKASLALFFSTNSTKRLPIIMVTTKTYLILDFYFQLFTFNYLTSSLWPTFFQFSY
jgi:hypothetical protein